MECFGVRTFCNYFLLPASWCLMALAIGPRIFASATSIAITGANAPGVVGAQLDTFTAGPVNADGKLVFTASLINGLGGVTSNDDEGVWLFDGKSTVLVAREGSAGVPGVPGANFGSFSSAAIDSTGEVTLRASLQTGGSISSSNNQGIWRYPGGIGALVAQAGSGNVPGIAGVNFAGLPTALQMASDGRVALSGTLAIGLGVSVSNDRGLWSYTGGVGTLVARESISNAPGVAGATFNTFGTPSINSSDQISFSGSLNATGSVTTTNKLGIWQYTGLSGTLVARSGVGNVPGVGGASFTMFDEPRQNSSGQVAFSATLDLVNDRGVWLSTNGSDLLLGRQGVGGVPGVAGANFDDFDSPLVNNAGQVLVRADLQVGPGSVTVSDNSGLWFLDGGGELVLRTGSGGVPEVTGANFSGFSAYSLNGSGQLAVEATLEIGVGGVNSGNDSGLWLINPGGISLLVARKGDTLAGRTIASVEFLSGSGGSDGQLSGVNDLGHLLFQAAFTNGDNGLFLFNPIDADFDFNGLVNAGDLLVWETGYSIGTGQTQGDSDSDQDVDGSDFLTWQQQLGIGTPPWVAISTVPEPATWLLLSIGFVGIWLASQCRHQCQSPP